MVLLLLPDLALLEELDGSYTGKDIDISIVFVDRSHEYSTTKLKNKICKYLK